ncbi:hypothetical protein FJTKL_05488 [Diaporthe vaccinii]|uniref:Uncharacterized protein n=1 Tax=Diaporthe vaccinii TaxID=105482 RepID=A0ABR4FG44_9PEZI
MGQDILSDQLGKARPFLGVLPAGDHLLAQTANLEALADSKLALICILRHQPSILVSQAGSQPVLQLCPPPDKTK